MQIPVGEHCNHHVVVEWIHATWGHIRDALKGLTSLRLQTLRSKRANKDIRSSCRVMIAHDEHNADIGADISSEK